jgi:hypothetical protein
MSTDPHDQTRPTARRRLRALLVLMAAVAAAVVLAACGSSSGSSGTTTSSSSSGTSTTQGGSGASRFASLRTCLQKEGINLPAPTGTPGTPGSGNGGRPGGFLKAPAGVSQAKFQEALKKCGAGNFPRGGGANPSSATARTALTNYATCMRANGINLPAPNTSGKGPVFNTSGLNTSSETFKNAQKKCQSDLGGAFGGGGGAPSGQPAA